MVRLQRRPQRQDRQAAPVPTALDMSVLVPEELALRRCAIWIDTLDADHTNLPSERLLLCILTMIPAFDSATASNLLEIDHLMPASILSLILLVRAAFGL